MIAPVPSHEKTAGLEAGTGVDWVPVDPESEAVPGETYRIRLRIKADYTPQNIQRLEETVKFGAGVLSLPDWIRWRDAFEVQSMSVSYPQYETGAVPVWTATIIAKKTHKGSPLAVLIGAIGLVVSLAILCSVVGYTVDKQGTKIESVAAATVFNPFFLIAAVIVVLAVKGRSLKSIGG